MNDFPWFLYLELETMIKDFLFILQFDGKAAIKYVFLEEINGQEFSKLLASFLMFAAKYENIQPLNRNRPRSF